MNPLNWAQIMTALGLRNCPLSGIRVIYGRRHIYPQVPKNVTRKYQLPELQTNHSHKQKLVIFLQEQTVTF